MARKHEAVGYLKKGYTPNRIAREMGVSVGTIVGYLYIQVGEGAIQRSDILFAYDKRITEAAERVLMDGRSSRRWAVQRRLAKKGIRIHRDDLNIYLELRNARVELGDLYESIRRIEIHLHALAQRVLKAAFQDSWWRHIPVEVRCKCVDRFEREEPLAAEPYCYTDFIDLNKIYDHLWGLLSAHLPTEFAKQKKRFLSELSYLNNVRNAIMHPVKGLKLDQDSSRRVRLFQRTIEMTETVPIETWQTIFANDSQALEPKAQQKQAEVNNHARSS